MWRLVQQLYYDDKVTEARFEAAKLGGTDAWGRDQNIVYAEAEIRELGTQWQLRPWLTMEAIETEVSHNFMDVADTVATECEALSRKFGWDNHEKTMVTFLSQEVEAHWMPGRWGYFVDKVPYDKICLPFHLTHDISELKNTVRHEFMHGITLNLGAGRANRWLNEGLSTYVENWRDTDTWKLCQAGRAEWVGPAELESLIASDHRVTNLQGAISRAYSQSNYIVRFLAGKFGEEKLVDLLKGLASDSIWETLNEGLFSKSHVDTALHKVYHLSEREVFDQAHKWVMETRCPGA